MKNMISMTSWMRNHIENLYNVVSTPMAATRDALTERLQSIRETASLLHRVVDNVAWCDRLKEKKRRKTVKRRRRKNYRIKRTDKR